MRLTAQERSIWLAPELLSLQGIPAAPLPHPAAPVQHQPTPRSAVLGLAPGRSGEAAAALWSAWKSRTYGGGGRREMLGRAPLTEGTKRPFESPIRKAVQEQEASTTSDHGQPAKGFPA